MSDRKGIVILGVFVADTTYRAGRMPRMGETVLGESFVLGPGGKGSNQAVAAGRLGADVSLITRLGEDDFGKLAVATWEAAVKRSAELGEGGRMEELTVARERATLERDMADAERQARNASAALARALGVPENEVAGLSLRPLPRELPTAPSLSSLQS